MILLAALALALVDPIALGRARADFGEILNGGKWKFVSTGQFGGTEIYFPSGRSDVRYYLVGLNGAGLRLCKQSRHDGKIRKNWLIEVKESNSSAKSLKIRGTLGDLLSEYDMPQSMPPEAREDLTSKCSFAVYHPQGGHGGPTHSFLKFREGSERGVVWRIPDTELKLIPRTKSPYPITPEELDEIKKGIAPAKN